MMESMTLEISSKEMQKMFILEKTTLVKCMQKDKIKSKEILSNIKFYCFFRNVVPNLITMKRVLVSNPMMVSHLFTSFEIVHF